MTFMPWSPQLALGVVKMDQEHQELIRVMNSLYDANEAKRPKAELMEIFLQLGKVTTDHFADEEAYMEAIGFAEIGIHKMIHQQLLAKFQDHLNRAKVQPGPLAPEVFDFLKMWLNAHIMGIDTKYARVGQRKAS